MALQIRYSLICEGVFVIRVRNVNMAHLEMYSPAMKVTTPAKEA